jgi:hypothetical protein
MLTSLDTHTSDTFACRRDAMRRVGFVLDHNLFQDGIAGAFIFLLSLRQVCLLVILAELEAAWERGCCIKIPVRRCSDNHKWSTRRQETGDTEKKTQREGIAACHKRTILIVPRGGTNRKTLSSCNAGNSETMVTLSGTRGRDEPRRCIHSCLRFGTFLTLFSLIPESVVLIASPHIGLVLCVLRSIVLRKRATRPLSLSSTCFTQMDRTVHKRQDKDRAWCLDGYSTAAGGICASVAVLCVLVQCG